jgi:hypothetical protein
MSFGLLHPLVDKNTKSSDVNAFPFLDFNDRPKTANDYHLATDMNFGSKPSSDVGGEVYAIAGGTVAFSGKMAGYGNAIIVFHEINGIKFTSLYGHISTLVEKGKVEGGVLLGTIAAQGTSSNGNVSPHLHFAIAKGHTLNIARGYTDFATKNTAVLGSDGVNSLEVNVKGEAVTFLDPLAFLKVYGKQSTQNVDADLEIRKAKLNDTDGVVEAGQKLRLDWEVKNDSSSAAAKSTVGVYLSSDKNFTSSELIETNNTSSLKAGKSDIKEFEEFDLPSDLAPGTYYLGLVADYKDTVKESNESNNVEYFQFTVLGGEPDLLLGKAKIDDTDGVIEAGQKLRLDWEVKNDSSSAAAKSTVGVYLSSDKNFTSSELIETNNTSSLKAGKSDTKEYEEFDLPSDLAPGTYYLGLVADYKDTVKESNESNNVEYFQFVVL